MKSQLSDDKVGEDSSEDDAEAAAEDGAHGQPESDVVVGVIFLHVDLSVVRPRVSTCIENHLNFNFTFFGSNF